MKPAPTKERNKVKIEDRPTPETEKLVERWDYSPLPKVMEAHARNLERQRDALREALELTEAKLCDLMEDLKAYGDTSRRDQVAETCRIARATLSTLTK